MQILLNWEPIILALKFYLRVSLTSAHIGARLFWCLFTLSGIGHLANHFFFENVYFGACLVCLALVILATSYLENVY